MSAVAALKPTNGNVVSAFLFLYKCQLWVTCSQTAVSPGSLSASQQREKINEAACVNTYVYENSWTMYNVLINELQSLQICTQTRAWLLFLAQLS